MTTPQQPPTGRHAATAIPPATYYRSPYAPEPRYSVAPQVPPQWNPAGGYPPGVFPSGPPSAPEPPKRKGFALGLASLITAVVGLPFGLFGSFVGFLLGAVAIGLAIAGFARRSGRALAVTGGVIAVVVVVASIAVPSAVGSSPSGVPSSTPSGSPSAPTTSIAQAPATTVAPTPPAPARTISAREWQKIAKDPGAHVGESIIVFGAVTQFDSATGTDSFRASVDGVRHQDAYEYETNTFLAGQASTFSDVVNGDMFRAEVVVGEPYTYTTTMGGQMTVPTLVVTKIATVG